MTLSAFALLLLPAHAEDWASGESIQEAAYADLTPEGLNAVSGLIPALLPSSIAIPDTSGSGGTWCFNYEYGISGAAASITVVNATISPGNGVLDITANLLVSLNDASDPFDLYTEVACIGDTCSGYVDPFPVTIATSMALEVVDDGAGGRTLDATMGDINVSYDLQNDDIHLNDCAIGTLEDVLDFFGLSLYDLLLGQLDGLLQDAVADLGPTLEETIEEAFASATINQELDLNGAVAQLSLQPADVLIQPDGVRVQMAGSVSAEQAACVAAFDQGGSRKTPTSAPDIGYTPSSVGSDYHVALLLSDDFANQAIYALWRGGLLCYTLDENGPFPLDTSILNLLTGDVFAELFPESKPVVLQTAPSVAPTVAYNGAHAVEAVLDDLGLELYAELDGREAKIVTIDLDGPVGIDLDFDGTTGLLGILVDLDPAALTPSIRYNEFYPDANETIVTAFSSGFGGIVDTVVGGLLSDLSFAVPAFTGVGLTDLATSTVGTDEDWLGAYAWVGPVPYEAADGCGGDCSSGCSGGCENGPGGPAFWTAIAGLLLLRRRS